MSGVAPVQVERDGAVARIVLARAEAGNAIDLATAIALRDAAAGVARDAGVRAVLLTGSGRFFCVGGDVAAFAAVGDGLSDHLRAITAALHAAMLDLANMPKPLVTAINGPAAGAGIALAAIGDIAVAAPQAHFTLAYTALGLSPDAGATWLLPRLIGLRRAQDLMMTNRRLSAAEAAELGLVTRVADGRGAIEDAAELVERLAAAPTAALAASRRLLLGAATASYAEQLDAESASIAALGGTRDGHEGIDAFLAKRRPVFTGES